MGKVLNNQAAELEADKIAMQFVNSHDVVKDMSAAYNADFSNIKIHTDSSADAKVKAADRDAIASGTDIFFGKGILESNHPASKGLLAHELAHTMQQGVVSSDGAVSETVSAGAEQGGKITDWFKRLFKKKTQHLGATEATEQVSFDDQKAMLMMEQTRYQRDRENAMQGIGKITGGELTDADIEKIGSIAGREVAKSNRLYADPEFVDKSRAVHGLGYHQNEEYRDITNKLFAGIGGNYESYLKTLDANGTDFKKILDQSGAVSVDGTGFRVGENFSSITGDVMDIMGKYLTSESGKKYISATYTGLKDAEVFKNGDADAMDYIIQNLMNVQQFHLLNAALREKYTQKGEQGDARNKIVLQVRQNLKEITKLDKIPEEERKVMPRSLQEIYAKYKALRGELEQAAGIGTQMETVQEEEEKSQFDLARENGMEAVGFVKSGELSSEKYQTYLKAMEFKGIDYADILSDSNPVVIERNGYNFGTNISAMTGDLINISGDYLQSDEGMKYLYDMQQSQMNSKSHNEEQGDVLRSILKTVFQSEAMKAATAMRQGNTLKEIDEGQKVKRGFMINQITKNMMSLPIIAQMPEEERALLPLPAKQLFEQYRKLEETLRQKLANYQGA